jgi:hypothetical protein
MRELSSVAEAELKKMPITFDIATDPFFGPIYRQGLKTAVNTAVRTAVKTAAKTGREGGRASMLREQLREKFGPLPKWVRERLDASSPRQIDALALKLLKCSSLDELFRRSKPRS